MPCFWTDLVGLEQECDGTAPPVASINLMVSNGYTSIPVGDMSNTPVWFDPAADFTTLVGGLAATFVYELANDRWAASGLPFCAGSGGEGLGTLTQGANTAPVNQTIACS